MLLMHALVLCTYGQRFLCGLVMGLAPGTQVQREVRSGRTSSGSARERVDTLGFMSPRFGAMVTD